MILSKTIKFSTKKSRNNIIIIICNSYIAPNPTCVAQSTSQFKTPESIHETCIHIAGKLILPDKNLTADQKLIKIGIMSLHKQGCF